MADKLTATAYKNQFNAQNYDKISLVVKKGKKEIIKSHAELNKKSLNSYINELIDNDINKNQIT